MPLSRIIQIALLEGGLILALFEAYLDESGCDDYSKVMSVGGLLIKSEDALKMDAEWKSALIKHDISQFHMVDCAHKAEDFLGRSMEQCVEAEKDFINIVNQYSILKFSCATPPFRHVRSTIENDMDDPYAFCVGICAMRFANEITKFGYGNKLALIYEAGHQGRTKAETSLRKIVNDSPFSDRVSSYFFLKKKEACILQGADLIAWQFAKRIKGMAFENRPMRKDFFALFQYNSQMFWSFALHDRVGIIPDSNVVFEGEEKKQLVRELFNKELITDPSLLRLIEGPL